MKIKNTIIVLSFFLGITFCKAQINGLPAFDTQSGVTKTVMNPKLFPLLLKVKISGTVESAKFYKEFVGSLTSFETYATTDNAVGETLVSKVKQFVKSNQFNQIETEVFERLAPKQKEFILIKATPNEPLKVYAFTTKLSFTDVQHIKLLLNQYF